MSIRIMPLQRLLIQAALFLATVVTPVVAQETPDLVAEARRASATRAELEAFVRAPANSPLLPARSTAAIRTRLVAEARQRLLTGDFRAGDRLVLRIVGDQPRIDTIAVGPDGAIRLAGIPAIPVTGVIASELDDHLTTQLGRYIRGVAVSGVRLVRVGVFGTVFRPGFYAYAADAPATEVITGAGGAAPDANANDVRITRAGRVIYDRVTVGAALSQSISLAGLGMRDGDVLQVGRAEPPADRNFYFQLAGLLASLASVVVLSRTLP